MRFDHRSDTAMATERQRLAELKKKAEHARKYNPGCFGGRELANEATNSEILELIRLNNDKAAKFNAHKEAVDLRNRVLGNIRKRM